MSTNRIIPELHFDGTVIDVLWDNHNEAINWYKKFMNWEVKQKKNWKPDPRCLQGMMTNLNWGTWLVSSLSSERLPHHFAERGTVESNIRVCWRIRNLQEVHRYFQNNGIRTTEIYRGPGNTNYFDFWATFEGTKLTAQEDNTLEIEGFVPSWNRVGVKDLNKSIEWYKEFLGMKLESDYSQTDYVIMSLKLNHQPDQKSLWVIEKLSEDAYSGRVDGPVRPICWVHNREQFFNYHKSLIDNGIDTSDIGGFVTKGMVSFHLYDLDGNRFNISSM